MPARARPLTAGTCTGIDWTNDGTPLRGEPPGAVGRASRRPRQVTDRPSSIALKTEHRLAGPERPGTGKSHGIAPSARRRSRPPRGSSASTPTGPSRGRAEVLAHTRAFHRPRQGGARPTAGVVRRLGQALPPAQGALRPDAHADAAFRLGEGAASFPADEKGVATRKASGEVLSAIAPELPELWGGRPTWPSRQHHGRGPTVVHPPPTCRPRTSAATSTAECALRHPRARAWAR